MESFTQLNIPPRCSVMFTVMLSEPFIGTIVCILKTLLLHVWIQAASIHSTGEQLTHPAVTEQTHMKRYWTYKFNRQAHRDPLYRRSVLINKVEAAVVQVVPAALQVTAVCV